MHELLGPLWPMGGKSGGDHIGFQHQTAAQIGRELRHRLVLAGAFIGVAPIGIASPHARHKGGHARLTCGAGGCPVGHLDLSRLVIGPDGAAGRYVNVGLAIALDHGAQRHAGAKLGGHQIGARNLAMQEKRGRRGYMGKVTL